ncbi:MAG: SPFH domain-containing protein [Actinomycetales bacterium]
MSTYCATVTREGRWWAVDVEGIGWTQGRNLAEARAMAVDLVAVTTEQPEDSIVIDLKIVLSQDVAKEVDEAKIAVRELAARQVEVARKSRKAARDLVAGLGISGRDAAVILNVSAQRVSQFLSDKP